jgi:hypothetical protein
VLIYSLKSFDMRPRDESERCEIEFLAVEEETSKFKKIE